jgi:GNAT superfamily N-acetyltransferase
MLTITRITDPDHGRWLQLWTAYQVFYEVRLPEAVTAATWGRLQRGEFHALGARDNAGVLQGFVHFLYHGDTWSEVPACYLQDLYVEPALRGTGAGRQLIEAVAGAAATAGANPPYWLTHETNATARRLYDRIGNAPGFVQYLYGSSTPGGTPL